MRPARRRKHQSPPLSFASFAALAFAAGVAACGGPPPAAPDQTGAAPAPSLAVTTPAAAPTAAASDPFAYDASAPLDVALSPISSEGGVTVQAMHYASPRGGRVPAILVQPAGAGAHPAILFQHWGQGDKSEFLDEAKDLAARGFVSLLVDAPFARPENKSKSPIQNGYAFYTQGGVDLLRGVDVLASLPSVDRERIFFVGHSFGAHLGAIVGARSPRVKGIVLMAGTASASRMMLESSHRFWQKLRETEPETLKSAAAQMAPLDAERFIGDVRVPVFHQFADSDEHISYEMAHAYFDKTPDPKLRRFYEADHALSPAAREDRAAFLKQLVDEHGAAEAAELARTPFYYSTRLPLAYPAPPPSAYRELPDKVYRSVDGRDFALDVYQPAGDPKKKKPGPAILLLHGQTHPFLLRNAKKWAGFQGLGQVLAARGYTVIIPNLGGSAVGPEPERWNGNIGRTADNAAAALAYVQKNATELGVDKGRIGLWTASASGVYGVGLALGDLHNDIRCVVSFYPMLSNEQLIATRPPLPPALIERLSPVAHIKRRGAAAKPVFIVRAGLDEPGLNRSIDAFMAEAKATKAPVTLASHDAGHHGFEVVDATDETKAFLEQAFGFLDRHLQAPNAR